MQKERRTVRFSGGYSPQGIFSYRSVKGNKRSKTDEAGGGRPKNDFLKKVFRPLPATRFNPLFNVGNYDCLMASAKNYAGLLGSHFDYRSSKRDFLELFRYLENLLPEGQHLLLTEETGKLSFKIFFGYDFLDNEVFFIPIILLNWTEGQFRDILLTFFRHLQQSLHLPRKEDLYDYEVIVNCYFEEWYEYNEDEEVRDFLNAYSKGYIDDTFSLIYQKPNRPIVVLEEMIKRYTPKNKKEKSLIATIKHGINILRMNKNIFNFVCRPEKDESDFDSTDDECIIEADRLIRFVYSGDDYVTDSYLESLNTEIGEYPSEYFPRNSLILTPLTDHLLEVNYVECFFSWLTEFINKLYEYEK